MTQKETERLATVEANQLNMAAEISELRKDMKANTIVTNSINSKLENLTGGKQALMWATGLLVSLGVILATWLGFHK